MKTKKTLLPTVLLIIAIIGTFVSCEKEDYRLSALHEQAQKTIKTYFKGIDIELVSSDNLQGKIAHHVSFTDKTKISFDENGIWYKIDSPETGVPVELVQGNIHEYIASNYNGKKITMIEKVNLGYKVELDNIINLDFDQNGTFIDTNKEFSTMKFPCK